MKKKHLTYGKKTLSVFLAVMMLMTCWVFVAPTEASAASAASYTVTLNFNLSNCAKGGNIIIHYYPVNSDGTLDKNNSGTYTFMNSLVQYSSGEDQTYTAGGSGDNRPAGDTDKSSGDIPGWPYKIVITTSGSWGTNANIAIKSIKVGNKTVLSTSSQWSCSNTSRTFEAGGTYDSIATTWPEPTWSVSSALGGATLQVPSCGTRTSGSLSASFSDQYGITWPQSSVSYSINGTGATLNQSNGSTTVSVTNDALANFNNASGTTNLTLTASGAGKTSTSTITLNAPKKDILYENLFSFSDWRYSDSYNELTGSSAEVKVESNDTIKIYKSAEGGEVTTGSSHPNNHSDSRYSIPITGGKKYTVRYDLTASVSGTAQSEVFLFWYDVNNNPITAVESTNNFSNQSFSTTGTCSVTFTAPADAAKAEIRFDNDCPSSGSTLRFKNIAVYPADRASAVDLENWPTRPVSKVYTYKAALGANLDVPSRIGYAFNGWYLDNNSNGVNDTGDTVVTDANGTVVSSLQSFAIDNNYNLSADWTALPYDIGYDNLFSLAEWSKTSSTTVGGGATGTIDYDLTAGTITVESVTAVTNNEVYTSYNADGYTMDVQPETEYVFVADVKALATEKYGQMFIFCYDASGNAVKGPTNLANGNVPDAQHIGIYPNTDGTHSIRFKTPANCYKLRVRVGSTNVGVKTQYSKIGLYKLADYDAYAKDYAVVRVPFYYGDTTALTLEPKREGYDFDGWYDSNDNKITSVEGLSASDTVYAKWTQLIKVEFQNYDGTVLKTEYVTPGAAATAPQNPTRNPDADYEYVFANWDTDFSNVTADLVVTAQYNTNEHGGIKYNRVTAADCETPGKITKTCTVCNYSWNNGEAFYDESGEYAPKLGHNYTEVVTNSSTGVDGVHKVACSRSGCTYGENNGPATIEAEHNFIVDADHPASSATCTVAGETYYKCACLEEKTITGATDPDNHTYDYTQGTPAGDGINHTVYCTGDATHTTKTVACTDTDKNCVCDICGQELIHNYINKTKTNLVSKAECEIDAVYYLTCQCGKYDTATWTDTGSALAHVWEDTKKYPATEANCTDDATYYKECSLCGISSATKDGATWTDEGSKWNHKFDGDYVNNGDGTHSRKCTNTGCDAISTPVACSSWKENATEGKCECTDCGYKKDHDWGDWSQADGNTDADKGKHTHTCNDCGAVETPDCVYTSVKTPATCTADAYTTYTCTTCGHGYTVIDKNTATGHNFNGKYKYNADTDEHQQLCANGCGEYGVGTTAGEWTACVWSYANAGEGKHTAICACGNSEEQNCSGGTATCTAKAECQFCKVAYGNLADHSYTGTEEYLFKATDATCVKNETYYYYCIGCKQTTSGVGTYEKPNTMTSHDYTCKDEYLYIATQAKCGVNETYYAYCSNPECKKSSEDVNNTFEKPDTALTHNWVNAKYNGGDSLTHTFTCDNTNTDGWSCDETLVASCADAAISFGLEQPTCTEQGYTTVQCSACQHTWNINYTEPLGHDYSKKIYSDDYLKEAANCEHANIYWYSCSRCDKHGKDETDTEKYTTLTFLSGEVRAHEWKNVVAEKYLADEATCFAAAKYYTSCKYEDCGKSSEEVNGEGNGVKFSSGSALAHNWTKVEDAKYLAKAADCVNDATYYYECSHCKNSSLDYDDGSTWTKENSKTGHAMTHTEAKAADCENPGNYEYWYCSTCKKYYKDADGNEAFLGQSATVIGKLGHDKVQVSSKAPTCEENGNPNYEYCTRCDYTTYPEVLPNGYKATGHNFTGAWTYDAVHNYHSKLCLNGCGDSGLVVDGEQVEYSVTYEGLDYVYAGGEECTFTYKAETSKEGVHSHALACECGNNNTKIYADEETFVETVAPTCTTDGYDSHQCPDEDCGDTWKKNIVKTEGHKLSETATSNGDGTHSFICTVCNVYKGKTAKCSGGTATCKDKAVCEICNTPYGETSDHTFTEEWVSNNDALCGVDGTEKNTCDVCKEEVTRTDVGSALKHEMLEYGYVVPENLKAALEAAGIVIKAPNCNAEGMSISYCSKCDHYVTNRVPKDKSTHVWATDAEGNEIWTVVSGNCATGVTYVKTCVLCGTTESKVENVGHTFEKVFEELPTCDEEGYRQEKCTVCGKVEDYYYNEETNENSDLAPLGHSVSEWTDGVVTCKENKYRIGECATCGKDVIEDFEEKGDHNFKTIAAVEATCEKAGHNEYTKCTVCGLEEGKIVETKEHADTNGDGKCEECNRVLYGDGEGSCGCICHKNNFLMRILYKILNFFWKLFKISKTCECGYVHW